MPEPTLPAGFTETPALPAGFSEAPPSEGSGPALPAGFSEAPPQNNPADWMKRVKPVTTHTGKPSVQREGDNGIWYGPDQGNTGKAGWFDAQGMRLGDAPGKGAGFVDRQINHEEQRQQHPWLTGLRDLGNVPLTPGLPSVDSGKPLIPWTPTFAGAVKGLSNLVTGPVQLLGHIADSASSNRTVTDETGAEYTAPPSAKPTPQISSYTDKPAQYIDNLYKKYFDRSISGEIAGEALPFILTGGASEAAEAPALISRLGAAGKYVKPLYNVAKGAITGGILAPALTPETDLKPDETGDTSADYWNRKKTEAKTGAVVGGTLSAAGEAAPTVIEAAKNAPQKIRQFFTGYKGQLPPEVTSGEGVQDILKGMRTDPVLNPPVESVPGYPELQGHQPELTLEKVTQLAQGDPNNPVTKKAAETLQRINVAASKETGVPLSLGDVTQNTKVMNTERALESKPGSKVAAFRQEQGEKLTQKINDLPEGKFDPSNPSIPHQFESQLETASAAGDKEASHVLDRATAARTNDDVVQASLEGQHWQNKKQANALYDNVDKEIEEGIAAAHPDLPPGTKLGVPLAPVRAKVAELQSGNANSILPNSEAASVLNELQLGKVTSYKDAKNAVSVLEGEAQRLNLAGNRRASKAVGEVATALDDASTKFAEPYLKMDYANGGKTSADIASDFYKAKVAPYNDPDVGISKIIRGEYADSATKRLYAVDSPKQFDVLYNSLDPKGQAALKAEMLERAKNHATADGTKSFDLQAWSRWMTKHDKQINTAFGAEVGGMSQPELLAHLISQTPRAGVGGATPIESKFKTDWGGGSLKTMMGLGGYAHGGPGQGLAALATEVTGEAAGKYTNNFIKGKLLREPNLNAWSAPPGTVPESFQRFIKASQGNGGRSVAPVITSQQAFDKLAPGSVYVDSNGNHAIKPE